MPLALLGEPMWKSAVGCMSDGGDQMFFRLVPHDHTNVCLYKLLFDGSVFSAVSMSFFADVEAWGWREQVRETGRSSQPQHGHTPHWLVSLSAPSCCVLCLYPEFKQFFSHKPGKASEMASLFTVRSSTETEQKGRNEMRGGNGGGWEKLGGRRDANGV